MKDSLALNLTLCVFFLGAILYLRIRSRLAGRTAECGFASFAAYSTSPVTIDECTLSTVLAEALEENSSESRRLAVIRLMESALGATGSPWAVEPLKAYLKALDEELESHFRAMVPVEPFLVDRLRNGFAPADCGFMLEGSALEDSEGLLIEALTDDPNGILGKSHVIPLMRTLSDDNLPQEIRYQAATALGRLKADVARDQLVASLDDRVDAVRYGSIQALASMGVRDAARDIAARLRDSNEFVRSAAAHALGILGDPQIMDDLIASCGDSSITVRFSALRSAVDLNPAGAKDVILAGLYDVDGEIRLLAARAAGSLKSSESLDPLIDLLRQSDGELRNACAEALFELEDPRAIQPLMEMLKDIDDDLMRMAEIRIKSDFDALDKTLDSDSVYVVGSAILTIVSVLPASKALDRLERMMSHKAAYVRESIATAIGNIRSDNPDEEPRCLPDEEPRCLPDEEPRCLRILEKLSRDRSSEVRYAVAKTLGKIRALSTLKILKRLSVDKSDFVSNAAMQAIEETSDKARSEKRIFIGQDIVRELLPM